MTSNRSAGIVGASRFSEIFGRLTVWHAVGLGLLVRVVVLLLLPDQDFPDARAYLESGQELFSNGLMRDHAYMPLYPIWTYITGGGVTLRLADILLSCATIWIIFNLSLVLFEDRVAALIAAIAASLWPHFAFFAVSGLTETAFTFVLCLAFLCFYRDRWVWAVVLMALSVLIKPTLDYLIPALILAFAAIVHRYSWKEGLRRIAVYLGVYFVLLTPWWIHQAGKYDAFVRLSLGDGIVLYTGNNPKNLSGGGITGVDSDISQFRKYNYEPIKKNNAMKAAAFRFIRENPDRFVKLAGMKFLRFWRLWPFAPEYRKVPIILASVASYGLMLAATIAFFLFYVRPYWRQLTPILLLTAYLTAVHIVTIASIRYRFPLEPFLIILGSFALARLGGRFAAREAARG